MALSSAASSGQAQGSAAPFLTSPITEWPQKAAAGGAHPPAEWAVISLDSSETRACGSVAARQGEGAAGSSPASSLPEESWQERDSGVEPQAAEERAGEEMTLVLLSLMEHYGASVGLTPHADITTGAVGEENGFPVFSRKRLEGKKTHPSTVS